MVQVAPQWASQLHLRHRLRHWLAMEVQFKHFLLPAVAAEATMVLIVRQQALGNGLTTIPPQLVQV
jgi:hypothetical protein